MCYATCSWRLGFEVYIGRVQKLDEILNYEYGFCHDRNPMASIDHWSKWLVNSPMQHSINAPIWNILSFCQFIRWHSNHPRINTTAQGTIVIGQVLLEPMNRRWISLTNRHKPYRPFTQKVPTLYQLGPLRGQLIIIWSLINSNDSTTAKWIPASPRESYKENAPTVDSMAWVWFKKGERGREGKIWRPFVGRVEWWAEMPIARRHVTRLLL